MTPFAPAVIILTAAPRPSKTRRLFDFFTIKFFNENRKNVSGESSPPGGAKPRLFERMVITMSTYMPKAETVDRKWYVLDAEGKPLGRVAATAAALLRGKHKTDFAPQVDCGDHVIIVNAEKTLLTGKKLDQKYYRYHTGYLGHLKEIKYRTLMEKSPEKAFELAVKGMLPSNSVGRNSLGRLRVYRGSAHNNAAQKPEMWAL